MNAYEFILIEKNNFKVYENISDYLFDSQKVALKYALDKNEENSYSEHATNHWSLAKNTDVRRENNIRKVRSFNLVKSAIWSCVLVDEDDRRTDIRS